MMAATGGDTVSPVDLAGVLRRCVAAYATAHPGCTPQVVLQATRILATSLTGRTRKRRGRAREMRP